MVPSSFNGPFGRVSDLAGRPSSEPIMPCSSSSRAALQQEAGVLRSVDELQSIYIMDSGAIFNTYIYVYVCVYIYVMDSRAMVRTDIGHSM